MAQIQAGRVALVTGASRGIGRAIAMGLARDGASVIALVRSPDAFAPLLAEAKAIGAEIIPFASDLAQADAIANVAREIASRHGKLDILVSNAAVMGPRVKLGEISEADWEAVWATNVTANWRLIRHLGPLMEKSIAPRAVFLTSGSGSKLAPGRGAYAISKSALDAVVRTWAAEADGTKLRVMLVNPGPTRTDMRASIMPDEDPLSLHTPADIAPKIAAMCRPDWQENGRFYDVPKDAMMSFRGPA